MAKLGAYMGALHGVEQFESWLGRSVDQVLGFLPGNGWSLNLDAAISSGYYCPPGTKKIVWSLLMYPEDGGVAALREVAAGQHVADHTRWAQQILASRAGDSDPIYIRPNWELGGEWYPWTGDAQQDPQAYRAAFQQFAQAFDNVSARFRIVWDVVGDRGDPTHLWPGDQYVDVIGQDHYWNPQWTSSDPVAAFHAHLNLPHGLNWLAAFAAQHGKPMAIPEFGVPGRTDWAPAPWEDPSNPGSLISVAPGTYDGATFIRLMKSWVNAHNVEFVNYWNDPAPPYDGRLSDGEPAAAAHALRDFFLT